MFNIKLSALIALTLTSIATAGPVARATPAANIGRIGGALVDPRPSPYKRRFTLPLLALLVAVGAATVYPSPLSTGTAVSNSTLGTGECNEVAPGAAVQSACIKRERTHQIAVGVGVLVKGAEMTVLKDVNISDTYRLRHRIDWILLRYRAPRGY
ncbi:hypothetical protein DFH09DRAFT_1305362 [Mycena vulgaris]|nr:hypothetical protein DFH09DRAFT_1305362 [Mycena vulgaris]